MEELPQPQPQEQLTVEGCPIVELSDEPDDVEHLLQALYVPTFHCQKKLPLSVVGAFIRLGRKYEFKDLFDSAMGRLTSQYPTTLEAYDASQTTIDSFVLYPGFDFDIVALASENNIWSALPCAYYGVLERFSMRQLFDTIENQDGTISHLSSLDIRRCVVAREMLVVKQFQPGYTLGWARKWDFDDDCTDLPRCRVAREAILNWYLEDAMIGALEQPNEIGGNFFKLCGACAQNARESTVVGRQKMWKELSEFFDLSPWNELKNDV